MKKMNKACSGLITLSLLAGLTVAVAPTVQAQSSQAGSYVATKSKTVYYKNCSAVRKAGKAPLYKGQPGYSKKLDRDKDGVACE